MKMIQSGGRVLAAFLMLGALAGCDDTVGPEDSFAELNADLALFMADAVDEDLAVMALSVPAGVEGGPSLADVDRTTTRSRTFYDGSGAVMDSYDPLLTASITTVTETSGAISRSGLEMTLDRSRTMTVSGLEGEETERTWNGTGVDARTRIRTLDTGESRSYDFSGTSTTTDVVRSLDRDAHPWPLSGTITREVVVVILNGPNGDETRTRTVTVTFNGTQFAELVVDGEVFEIDLDQRGRTRVRRTR